MNADSERKVGSCLQAATTMSNRRSSNGKREVKISPVCNKCRERHLKCDGGPQCSRCKQEGVPCQFRPSRRGMRPSDRRTSTPTSDDGYPEVVAKAQTWVPSQRPILAAADPPGTLPSRSLRARSSSGLPSHLSISTDVSTYLTDLFYANFYPSHSFVLPREQLVKELAAVEHCPLQAVIEYLGTFYDANFNRSGYQHRAEELLSTQQYPSDGSLVQALLILAIALNADGYAAKADVILQRARRCAITIGMDDPAFSCLGPGGQVVQVESWRRTWFALQDLCQSWQAISNLTTTTPDLSRCTTVESTAALEATIQFEPSSTLTTSTAWKGFGSSPFGTGSTFHSNSAVNTRHGDRNRDDNSTNTIDELLAQAGLYDGADPRNAKRSTGWRSQWDIHGISPDNRPAAADNEFTRMLSQE